VSGPGYQDLPGNLPVPEDDGAAAHLPGQPLPHLVLRATAGPPVDLSALGSRPGRPRAVLFVYPRTGQPGVPLPPGWDGIPGARGCTPEACGFRDAHADLAGLGADVYGLSSQDTEYQAELAERLGLPFPVLSDPELELAGLLGLPTFTAGGEPLFKRLTMIVSAGAVEHVFYPVFPPDGHAAEVAAWLSQAG